MNKTIFITGIFFGFLAVVLGAFGSHVLGKVLLPEQLDIFNTGVTYQMYHSLLMLILGGLTKIPEQEKRPIYWVITLGILLFSFSIYFLATNALTSFNFKWIAFATPLGGILLISGWLLLGYRYVKDYN